MTDSQLVKASELREGDAINLTPLLDDEAVYGWVWQPFGRDETQRRGAIETARLVAQCECAVVESAETVGDGTVIIYNDQLNLTVPEDHSIPVEARIS